MTGQSIAYLSGRFLPASEACLPLHDAGFVMGATATDLCRTFRHQLFRLADHLARFRQSCELARIPQPVADDELTRIAEHLIRHNAPMLAPGDDLGLVMFATPGPIGWYAGLPGGPGDGPPTIGMHTFSLPFGRFHRLFTEGARLVVPSVRHLPAASVDPRIKQRSRLFWWLAEQEARAIDPGASALLLNETGQLTETAAANLLVVKNGTVLTPPRSTVLNGISLMTVEELCRGHGIPFEEQPLVLADCLAADEAMVACTSYCLAPVSRIEGRPIPFPGLVFEQSLAAWSRRVGLDIRGQILANR